MATNTTTSRGLDGTMTQTFRIACPEGVDGIYVTRIDLYFSKKSTSYGAELSIVNLTNGLPDPSNPVSDSTVTLQPESISVSDDASLPTSFSFNVPIFLIDKQHYAFTIRSLGNNPDYQLWTAITGGVDATTGLTVSSNPLSEDAYFAKNSTNWAVITNEDFKYTIFRAQFNVGSNSTAVLRTDNSEIFSLTMASYASGNVDVRAGDEVYALINGVVDQSYKAIVASHDIENNYLYLKNSTGNFREQMPICVIRTASELSLANSGIMSIALIDQIIDFPLHSIVPKFGVVSSPKTTVSLKFQGTYKAGSPAISVKDTNNWVDLTNNQETEFYDTARYVLSRSNEIADISSNSSVDISFTMSSDSDYQSPIIDLKSKSIIAVKNLINSDIDGEDGRYGQADTRYISKIVTLAEGQDSEDLQLWLTAYKPVYTEINVYAKLWNSEDADNFDTKPWTKMVQSTQITVYSSSKDTEDYKEYEYMLPTTEQVSGSAYVANTGIVQYSTTNGLFIGYKKYSIKVVLSVVDDQYACTYPRLNDLRSISLQK